MALFSRRKKDNLEASTSDAAPGAAEEDEGAVPAAPPGEPGVDRDWDRLTDGPWDESEFADRDSYTRMDFGAMRVAVLPEMQVRVEADRRSKQPVSVTCVVRGSLLQLQVFAAPRRAGIWDDIRQEIAAGLVTSGGTSQEVEGPFGTELRARMAGRASDGRVAYQPARFIGIDGPRWFLRAVISGQGARDEQTARALLALIRHTVIVRGEHPMPPRESLTLTVPQRPAAEQQPDAGTGDPGGADGAGDAGAGATPEVEAETPPTPEQGQR